MLPTDGSACRGMWDLVCVLVIAEWARVAPGVGSRTSPMEVPVMMVAVAFISLPGMFIDGWVLIRIWNTGSGKDFSKSVPLRIRRMVRQSNIIWLCNSCDFFGLFLGAIY